MMTMYPNIPFVKVDPDVPTPKYANLGDAGMDLCSMEDVTLAPGETRTVRTGVAMAIPEGFVGLVFPRSGLGAKGLTLSNCVGVIDSIYRGEIKAPLHNNHPTHELVSLYDGHDEPTGVGYEENFNDGSTMHVRKGDHVCQIVIVPYATATMVETVELDATSRGQGSFGSTGTRERL